MSIRGITSNIRNTNSTLDPLLGLFPNKLDNPLKDFDTVTYKFSFGAISEEERNSLAYLQSGNEIRSIVIGESGYTGNAVTGIIPSQSGEAVPNVGQRAVTRYGVPEYYIDNVVFKHYLPSERSINTGLASVKFEVTEPYSLGLFFDSLLVAAAEKGHRHFNDDCCFILRIDFQGFKDGNAKKLPPKFIPLRIRNIEFTANESGSKYNVECYEFASAITTSDVVAGINFSAAFGIVPDSVPDTLALMAASLNDEHIRRVENGIQQRADRYLIELGDISDVRTAGGTPQANPPGWDDMTFDIEAYDAGNRRYINPDDYDPSGVNLRLRNEGREFIYDSSAQGEITTVMTVLDDVMCHTSYASTTRENINEGFMWWWTIQTDVRYPERAPDSISNRNGALYIYRIVPYRVRVADLTPPAQAVVDGAEATSNIRKVYSYLYTGQNDDILSYEMNFNNMFYLAQSPTGWENMSDPADRATVGDGSITPNRAGDSGAAVTDMASSYRAYADQNAFPLIPGGAGADNRAIQINRFLNGAITGGRNRRGQNGVNELVQLELTLKITGDPYYIPIGGLGNQRESNDLLSMAWEGQQVRIYVRFKTIVDAPQQGNSLYVQRLNGQKDHPFSGVYRILRIDSAFNDGVFTQTLKLYRDLSQNQNTSNASPEAISASNQIFVDDAVEVPETVQGQPAAPSSAEE